MRGFTLLETIIYIAIASIVVASFTTFALSISDSRNKSYVAQEVQANTRTALELIRQNIYASDGVQIASSIFNTSPGYLVLTMPISAQDPTIIRLDGGSGVIFVKAGSSAEVPITSDTVFVDNLVFTNLSGVSTRDNIQVAISVSYRYDDSVEFSYSQSARTAVGTRQ
jgi:type II secretory pathway pseudopilin PulG